MYLMYVDESGDSGTQNSPSRFFVLSAIILHESFWLEFTEDLVDFRRGLRSNYGLLLREEIHASDFINGRPNLRNKIGQYKRLMILKECLKWLNTRQEISIITVRHDKQGYIGDVFKYAWLIFLQRFENTLVNDNFPGGYGTDKGIVISDNTDGRKLTSLLRKMRRFNPIPHDSRFPTGIRDLRVRHVIEDPSLRDSKLSLIHQMTDVVVYFARQYYEPNRYIKRKGAKKYYQLVEDVTNSHVTRYPTSYNIVEI